MLDSSRTTSSGHSTEPEHLIGKIVYWANKGDILKTIDQIAQSLTNQMRSGPQSLEHHGEVWRTEQYMRVDWPWLAYPVALLTAVSALLFA